jgi:hypothetical protein
MNIKRLELKILPYMLKPFNTAHLETADEPLIQHPPKYTPIYP